MTHQHDFTSKVIWTGNCGTGTQSYRGYKRTWNIAVPGKPVIHCSNDPLLGGDPRLMNPEDLLISALSACHMLWYLHLASSEGISVVRYTDTPIGNGESEPNGAGKFLSATLKPDILIEEGGDLGRAVTLHDEIHQYCFIARSVNFPVTCAPTVQVAALDG